MRQDQDEGCNYFCNSCGNFYTDENASDVFSDRCKNCVVKCQRCDKRFPLMLREILDELEKTHCVDCRQIVEEERRREEEERRRKLPRHHCYQESPREKMRRQDREEEKRQEIDERRAQNNADDADLLFRG